MKEKILSLEALEAKMVQTRVPLSGFIFRMVGQRETAEELFQETWLKVVRNLDTYRTDKPFEPWLFRIARNLCLNHLKQTSLREKKDRRMMERENRQPPPSSLGTVLPGDVQQLNVCIEGIPQKFREVIRLRFFEEMAFDAIAVVLDLPVGTVYSRVNRGLKHLRKCWEKQS